MSESQKSFVDEYSNRTWKNQAFFDQYEEVHRQRCVRTSNDWRKLKSDAEEMISTTDGKRILDEAFKFCLDQRIPETEIKLDSFNWADFFNKN